MLAEDFLLELRQSPVTFLQPQGQRIVSLSASFGGRWSCTIPPPASVMVIKAARMRRKGYALLAGENRRSSGPAIAIRLDSMLACTGPGQGLARSRQHHQSETCRQR